MLSPPLSVATQAADEMAATFTHKLEAIEECCRELEGRVWVQVEAMNKRQKVEEERDLLRRSFQRKSKEERNASGKK